ncbi:MAG: hypothetical protein R2746_08065 [Acidimicrobiales bacterium]
MHEPEPPLRRSVPVLQVLGSITSLQLGAALASRLFDRVGAAGATMLRLNLSAVVLTLAERPRIRSWTAPQRRAVALLGVTLAAMNSAFYGAVARLPLGAAITIEFLGPLGLAAVLSCRLRDGLWVVLALAGVTLLGLSEQGSVDGLDPVGVVLALGGRPVLGRLHRGRGAWPRRGRLAVAWPAPAWWPPPSPCPSGSSGAGARCWTPRCSGSAWPWPCSPR